MFCIKCGAQLSDDALFCPHCGSRIEPDPFDNRYNAASTDNVPNVGEHYAPPPAQNYYAPSPVKKAANPLAIVGFVLSFISAVAGLICSIIAFKKAQRRNLALKGMALAGIIISASYMGLLLIIAMFGGIYGVYVLPLIFLSYTSLGLLL